MTDALIESHNAEALNALAVAEEAKQKAQSAEMHSIVTTAMKEVLTQGDEGTKRLLIQKIPLLCTDVMTIKNDIRDIKNNQKWQTYIGMAFCTAIGLLALKSLGI